MMEPAQCNQSASPGMVSSQELNVSQLLADQAFSSGQMALSDWMLELLRPCMSSISAPVASLLMIP